MDFLRVIRERRSIREYQDKPLPKGALEKILDAGRWAPSGLNNQPWRFFVIENRDKLLSLSKFTKYAAIIANARLALCVFLDYGSLYNRDKDIMAVGACIENMLLAAHALGVASCWLGEIINRKKEVQEFLKIDEDLELMAVVTLGISAQDLSESCRKDIKSLLINK